MSPIELRRQAADDIKLRFGKVTVESMCLVISGALILKGEEESLSPRAIFEQHPGGELYPVVEQFEAALAWLHVNGHTHWEAREKALEMFPERNCGFVIYAACPYGYRVQVWRSKEVNGTLEVIHEYTAGNHQKTSTDYVALDSLSCEPFDNLVKMAKQTAFVLAEEYGIPVNRVEHDDDLETALKEELGGEPNDEG